MLDVTPAFHPIWGESGTIGRAALRLKLRVLDEIPRSRRMPMREKRFLTILLLVPVIAMVGAGCNSQPNVSGVWKGSIDATDKQAHKWHGPAELTLNQNGNAITGTLSFTHPQGGRVQVPISSGAISKDAVTFSRQNQFPMGTLELTFHGKVADASLSGTADMTSRSLLIGPVASTASLSLKKQ
jgi:hypothetical protein